MTPSPRPDTVGGARQEHAPGAGVALQGRHGEMRIGGDDVLGQVIDGVDVAPGLIGGTVGGLDTVEVHAVRPEVRPAHEHDDPRVAPARFPENLAQACALPASMAPL